MPSSPRRSSSPTGALLLAAAFALAGCGGGASDASGPPGEPTGAPAPPPSAAAPAPQAGGTQAGGTQAGGTQNGTPGPIDAAPAQSAPLPAPPGDSAFGAGAGCALAYSLTGSPALAGADPLFVQQWHLRNTGQAGGGSGEDLRVLDAWSSVRGAGVRVAVIDDAVEVLHPDLRPNLVDGASRSYRPGNPYPGWPLPCTESEDHGTAVAGLVLARDDNAIGGAGVAPRASLVAFDALSSGLDVDVADALGRDADRNAVYQNSWGSPDDGALHPAEPVFVQAIERGLAAGRGGLGSVFVFAGGNGGCYASKGPFACHRDDSNYDGYVNHLGVIAVCAVDGRGLSPSYAEPGANLTVCAPSSGSGVGVTTTALGGGYRRDFTGTSASTPMVSGVAALMLAANPALTWRDVRLILATSARRNDPGDADWIAAPGAPAFNHKYGFGVADAGAAVAMARTWTSVGGSDSLIRCGPLTASPNAPLPDRSGAGATPVTSTIAVAGCGIRRIEFVEVRLTAPHDYAGDLRVRLTSPSGATSRLAEARACAGGCGTYADWRFGSMRHLDEPADGPWTLQVTDDASGDIGAFQRWTLVLHGR
jgi:proprotein convertase subtilisin/kexin type 2